jgi:circadian clock protein KaiB
MKTMTRRSPRSRAARRDPDFWHLRLYVAGQTPRSLAAFANLRRLCEQHLPDRHEIEVIDLFRHPELAKKDQIVAIPTLVRRLPEPVKRLIGDLSNTERVLLGIELTPAA